MIRYDKLYIGFLVHTLSAKLQAAYGIDICPDPDDMMIGSSLSEVEGFLEKRARDWAEEHGVEIGDDGYGIHIVEIDPKTIRSGVFAKTEWKPIKSIAQPAVETI